MGDFVFTGYKVHKHLVDEVIGESRHSASIDSLMGGGDDSENEGEDKLVIGEEINPPAEADEESNEPAVASKEGEEAGAPAKEGVAAYGAREEAKKGEGTL